MCKCDFGTEEYLDAVLILHPIYPTSIMVLLGDYCYVDENTDQHIVLGNVRHNNKVEIEADSVFQVANDSTEAETNVLPIVQHLVAHPEDVVVVTADMNLGALTWKAVKKSERASL